MNETEKIFEQLDHQSFSITRFFKRNIRGILGTLMFHMFLLIVFLLIKIQGFKQDSELDILFDYSMVEEPPQQIQPPLSKAEQALLDRLMSQADNVSNRAANISENLEKEISTESFVNEYLKQLDEDRSEEWRKQQEEINKQLSQPDYVPPVIEDENDIEVDDYSGPSNISYEFLDPPFKRFKVYLPVPVYKCQGEGIVNVMVVVDQTGKVISAESSLAGNYSDRDCLLEVARNFAMKTRFEGNIHAPKNHRAKITYQFIPQ